LAQSLNSSAARAAVTRHLNGLQSTTNMTQFTAQCHEVACVRLLVSFAKDEKLPPGLRRKCALDILRYARGLPVFWKVDPATIDPDAPGSTGFQGATVGDEIVAAQLTSDLYIKLNDLIAQGILSKSWPPDIVAIASDIVDYYTNEDTM
jgi:hypothetical protein